MNRAELEKLAARLGDVRSATEWRYGTRDDRNVTMDCLRIVAASPGDYLGISHALVRPAADEPYFSLNLAHSTDLLRWRYVTTLDNHASQGELYRDRDGSFLIAYEHDEPNSVYVRVRRYADRAALEKGRFATEVTLGRTLAPTAEGTPTIERVSGDTLNLRFHYYRNGDVDRAARGVLRGWKDWKTEPDPTINQPLEALGCRGNIGGRSRFIWQGKTFYMQEGQGVKNDWSSWHVYLLSDEQRGQREAVQIPMRTHAGSTSFANPSVTILNEPGKPPRAFVSLFLPSQGNAPGEVGELIYILPLSA